MNAVLQAIRILVVLLFLQLGCCQDGFNEQDILRIQQIAANEGPVETITSYSTNIIQRDPSSQSVSSVSVQYHMTDDDKNDKFTRRNRKIYRIKDPFQRQPDDQDLVQDNNSNSNVGSQDSANGASNQYAAMQYSLPPEDFLQQMRAENQYHQQQQLSTQAPALSYTATPQPQYQYSTIAASNYDNNQQFNQPHIEPKSMSQSYHSNPNIYQFNGPNYNFDNNIQSTPSPIQTYLSTPLPGNNPFLGTPSSTYVSSSSPIYLSSSPNLQQYVSSPLSTIQAASPDYNNNRATTTVGNSFNYDHELNKKMHIDHYDISANGMRYPINLQQQYQNEYPSTTVSPVLSTYPESVRDNWQNNNVNPSSKSAQELSNSHYQNYRYNNDQSEARQDDENQRLGSQASANNLFLNYVQPDYQFLNSLRSRSRDEHENSQQEAYSHGDYGWKLSGKKSFVNHETPTTTNYPRYYHSIQPDNAAVSQMSFHMDTGKQYGYDQISKSAPEKLDPQEFAKAAAKAQQQQMEANNNYLQYSHNSLNNNGPISYYSSNEKQRNKIYGDSSNSNPYTNGNSQSDLITASPYYYSNAREILESKPKQPFDHDKALKNIVPIDVSNVVPNSESQTKISTPDSNGRFNIANYNRDQPEQNYKQYYKPVTDAYYKDKNTIYGFNIKTKPDDGLNSDGLKQAETSSPYYGKPQAESYYGQGSFTDNNKRYAEETPQPHNYISQLSNNYQDNVQSLNIQQQRPQNLIGTDISSILKLNDIPYRLTQGLNADSLRLNNPNYDQPGVPTQLPVRLNQNVDIHQLDVATNILNKLMNKPSAVNVNRPEIDSQAGGLLSTINGFKVANPFNVDLKLVADMLKGKPAVDDSHLSHLRDQFNKPAPLKLDVSQLQQFLIKNDNSGSFGGFNSGLSGLTSPYFDIYSSGRYPYQGVKYSRSQEEEESIPIADASNTHPIGAVMEQDDSVNTHVVSTGPDLTAAGDDTASLHIGVEPSKNMYHRAVGDRHHRHPNSLLSGRHSYQRKYPKSDMNEPYPLLKPPPPHISRSRGLYSKMDKHSRRRRVHKPKVLRVFKTEPLYEAESSVEEDVKPAVTTLLRPPPPVVEEKSDISSENRD